jgi:hypothetical protein
MHPNAAAAGAHVAGGAFHRGLRRGIRLGQGVLQRTPGRLGKQGLEHTVSLGSVCTSGQGGQRNRSNTSQ